MGYNLQVFNSKTETRNIVHKVSPEQEQEQQQEQQLTNF